MSRSTPTIPSAARQLLDEAGWKDSDGDGVRDQDGMKLAFVLLGNDKAMIEAISAAWASIGVQAAPQPVTPARPDQPTSWSRAPSTPRWSTGS